MNQVVIVLPGLQEVVFVGVRVKRVSLLEVDVLVEQSQADFLRILHDALAGIVQGLDDLLVDTTGGVMYEGVAIEL